MSLLRFSLNNFKYCPRYDRSNGCLYCRSYFETTRKSERRRSARIVYVGRAHAMNCAKIFKELQFSHTGGFNDQEKSFQLTQCLNISSLESPLFASQAQEDKKEQPKPKKGGFPHVCSRNSKSFTNLIVTTILLYQSVKRDLRRWMKRKKKKNKKRTKKKNLTSFCHSTSK